MTLLGHSRRAWLLPALLGVLALIAVLLIAVPRITGGSERPVPATGALNLPRRANTPSDRLVTALQQKIRENPKDYAAHVLLATTYLQQVRETGDPSLYTKVGQLLDQASKLAPESVELVAARATLALGLHDFARALELGKQAAAADPRSPRYHGIVGDAQIELGQYDEAINSYQRMVDLRPDFASYSRVSHARELHGDLEGAIQLMQATIEAGSTVKENMAWAHVQLGNLWFSTNELDRAVQEYELALKSLENYAPALAGKARIAAARNELAQAAKLYQEAFNRMPLPEYAILLGDVYARMGNERGATEQYDLVRAMNKLFEENGVNIDMETALFLADHEIDLETSLAKARAAYTARPSIHAADALAWTLYKTRNYEEAARYSAEALKLGTRDPLMLFHAGLIAKALGNSDEARKHLEAAVGLNPHFSLLYSDAAAAALKELRTGASPAPIVGATR